MPECARRLVPDLRSGLAHIPIRCAGARSGGASCRLIRA